MFAPSRDEARRFFFDTWTKYRTGQPLAGLEQTVLSVILLHPEYHPFLEDPERYRERDFAPEAGSMNPFLHLSLHLAVEEQLAIDQPPGIAARYRALAEARGSEHDAKHDVVECLGEVVWQAQRTNSPPDERLYLACLDRKMSAVNAG